MNQPRFSDLGLDEPLLRALSDARYEKPTPIQQSSIPDALAGRDLLGIAQTGTGKTAAFSLPILQHLSRNMPPRRTEHEPDRSHRSERSPRSRGGKPRRSRPPRDRRPVRALIVTPTRELALQVQESLEDYGRYLSLKTVVILGGVSARPQIQALENSPDILVATPGRLLDLIGQGYIDLSQVEVLVLDEADRMLDMGFIHDVRRIVSLVPEKRQTLFFSATMPKEVTSLAQSILNDPIRVEVTPESSVSQRIAQFVLFVERTNKGPLLFYLVSQKKARRVLVFARTKHRANRIAKQLCSAGVSADAIHSNKTQGARQRALASFAEGKTKVLVATDIVARGIDVDNISHVINFDLPDEPESYVHRIGRTARAGSGGVALAFCDRDEGAKLGQIQVVLRDDLRSDREHPFFDDEVERICRSDARTGRKPAKKPQAQRPPRKPKRPGARSGRPKRASGGDTGSGETSRRRKRRPGGGGGGGASGGGGGGGGRKRSQRRRSGGPSGGRSRRSD